MDEAKEADEKVKLENAERNTKEREVKAKEALELVNKRDTEKREKSAVMKEQNAKQAKKDEEAEEKMNEQMKEMMVKMEKEMAGEKEKEVKDSMAKLVSAGKPTRQSSVTEGGAASRAVDGDTHQNYGEDSCTHTKSESQPWWSVDLQRVHNVEKVEIYNRVDCCSDRLAKVKVVVDGETCGEITSPKPINTVDCGGKLGVSVKVQGTEVKPLTVCEVKVYGVVATYAQSYLGCYKDDTSLDLQHGPQEFGYTTTSCMVACSKYKFIALQNSGWCSCDNDYSTPPDKYSKQADTECRGGVGGSSRNAIYKNEKYGLTSDDAEVSQRSIPPMPTTGGFCSGRGNPLKMTTLDSWDDCGESCADFADCSCFEYNPGNKQCRLTKGVVTKGGPCCRSAAITSHGEIPMV